MRKLLSAALVSDADLDAFCIDHFPEVKKRFASGMDRLTKFNILLEQTTPTLLFQVLAQEHPDVLSQNERLLRFP